MLSRLTLLLSIVMIFIVIILLSPLYKIGEQIGKRSDIHHPQTIPSSTIDIDTEIMRRVQRIGSFTSTDFVKSGTYKKINGNPHRN
jgi:hypothetical protein